MANLTEKQEENLRWFDDNLNEILENPKYRNKYLVIHKKGILASFSSEHHAVEFVAKTFKNFDDYLIQEVFDEDITVYVD